MFDFELTNSGDLKLCPHNITPVFCISWHTAKYPVMNIQFTTRNNFNVSRRENTFEMSFNTKLKHYSRKTLSNLHDIDSLKQNLVIKLRTEFGSSFKKDLGTKLVQAKHLNINDADVINWIRETVLNDISDIVENPEVEVIAEKNPKSNFYCQNVNVYIYQDGRLLYDFSL